MRLKRGEQYTLMNLATSERAELVVQELLEYQGQYIVWGRVLAHQVRVFRGVITVPERPCSFVVLPHESGENIQRLVRILGGLPLAIVETPHLYYIVNMGRVPGIWNGEQTYDAHMQKCRKVIELYHDWRRLGALPAWFQLLRAAANVN